MPVYKEFSELRNLWWDSCFNGWNVRLSYFSPRFRKGTRYVIPISVIESANVGQTWFLCNQIELPYKHQNSGLVFFFFFGTSTILEKYEARSILWLKSYLFPNSMKSILFSYYCPLHVVRVSEDRHTFSAPLGSESINREWWYIFCVNSVIGRTFDSVVVTWNNVPLNSCRPPELRVYEAASRVQRSAVAMQISGVDITAVRAERKYGASDWRHK